MKKVLPLLIFLIFQIPSYSQSRIISGKVYNPTFNFEHPEDTTANEESTNYKIYLLRNNTENGKGKLKFTSKRSSFRIELTKKELKKYNFLEFIHRGYRKLILIDQIPQDSVKIMLEMMSIRVAKPAIYLYPTERMVVEIKHKFLGELLNTYPQYNERWKVIAEPNGKLLNVDDNRSYNYLFWDGNYKFKAEHYNFKDGFYVSRNEIVVFLQDKLSQIGLNETEINDFIIFWLPILNENELNFIHFRINDNIDNSSFLEVNPKPNTQIRVFMEFKPFKNESKKLPEQKLDTIIRNQFTLVEWGGSRIGTDRTE